MLALTAPIRPAGACRAASRSESPQVIVYLMRMGPLVTEVMGLRVIGLQVSIAATPAGRWLFPVAGGGVLAGELADDPDVALHAEDDWVALPPSPCGDELVHWRVTPSLCGWQLPRLDEVTEAVPDVGAPPLARR